MGRSINKNYFLWLVLGLFILPVQNDIFSQTKGEGKISKPKLESRIVYYGYWNPYRTKLEIQKKRDNYIARSKYEATKNKSGKLKTKTK